ncbi:hypothetical protein GCM10027594_16100 [Hymenobacter agri]
MPVIIDPKPKTEPLPSSGNSEELDDIISTPPAWIVQWGITLFFLLLLAAIAGSWLIHYPDLVQVPLQLTTVNAPKPVNAKGEGTLVKLLTKEGDSVRAYQILAYLESTGDHAQILAFEKELNQLRYDVSKNSTSQHTFHTDHLGELQTSYQEFEQAYTQYLSFQKAGFFPRKRLMLVKEIVDLTSLNANLGAQQQIHHRDLDLAQKEFNIQKALLQQGVIAPTDLRKQESQLLNKQLAYKQAESLLIQSYTTQTAKRKELLELDKLVAEQKSVFEQAINTLRSSIDAWKNRYVVVAPIGGRVFFSSILEEKQTLRANQELFYIDPQNSAYYGEAIIPQVNIGKVRVGQTAQIKLAGYPFEEFGMINGRVSYISQISSKENGFMAKIILPNGLVTTYGKNIAYRNGISATASIITEDSRLIEKIFYNFRKALAR